MNDRMIDDSVSKAQYMKILVNTIKDDLAKISSWFAYYRFCHNELYYAW